MNGFPGTADEFYRLRDDRTNRCIAGRDYQRVSCAVYVSPASASTAAGQIMLAVAANLLSRWCRQVTIIVPRTPAHARLGLGRGDLGELVLSQMRDADPFGEFHTTTDEDAAAEIGLHIGAAAAATSQPTVFMNASGWLASLSRERPIEVPLAEEENHLGAIAAACLGVAQAFKLAVRTPPSLWFREGVFDLFRLAWSDDSQHGPWPDDLNIGKALMVGAGSVGSSAAYCARICGLAGTMEVVDRDTVKIENFNRSPVFGKSTFGLTKAAATAAHLSGSSLVASAVPLWWADYANQRARSSFDFDVWLPLANEFGVRLAMQHSVPPLMIHASTTSNWGVNHARHVPGRDDCLADRFPAEASAASLTCATGWIETAENSVDAALPFVSFFAGLLVAAELVRLQVPGYPHVPNFALLDWYGSLDTIQAWDRKPRDGCVCQDQGRGFHDRFNGDTRYRSLFNFS